MSEYPTLLNLIEKSDDQTAYALLEGEEIASQIEAVEKMLRTAIRRYDDSRAKRYLEWLLHGISYETLESHLVTVGGKLVWPSSSATKSATFDEAAQIAECKKVDRLLKLWSELPRYRTATHTERDSGQRHLENGPTMLQTKQDVLARIADHWRQIADEGKADHLVGFLQGLPYTYLEDERKMRAAVIRKAVDHRFPVARLERHLINYGQETSSSDELWRALVIGWARNSNPATIRQQLTTMQPLATASCAAHDLSQRLIVQVAALEAATRLLQHALIGDYRYHYGHDFYREDDEERTYLYGKLDTRGFASVEVDTSYSDLETVQLSLTVIAYQHEATKRFGVRLYDGACAIVERWQVDHRQTVQFEFKLYADKRQAAVYENAETFALQASIV